MPKRRGPRNGRPPIQRGGPPRKLPLPPRFASAPSGSIIPLAIAIEGDSAFGTSLVATRVLSGGLVGDGYVASSPLVAVRPLSSGLAGDGYLASSPLTARRLLALGIVGDGYLTPAVNATRVLALGLAGDGYLEPSIIATRIISASLAGSGNLGVAIGALRLMTQSVSGSGVVGASLSALRVLGASLQGVGTLAAQLIGATIGGAMVGSSEMSVELVPPLAALPSTLPDSVGRPILVERRRRGPDKPTQAFIRPIGVAIGGTSHVSVVVGTIPRRSTLQEELAITLLVAA